MAPTSHVCEFFGEGLLRIPVLGLDGVLNGTRHRVVDTQDGTLHQVDLSRSVTAQGTRATPFTGSLVAIAPGTEGVFGSGFGFLVRGRGEDRRTVVVQSVATDGVCRHGRIIEGRAVVTRIVALQQRLFLLVVLMLLGVVSLELSRLGIERAASLTGHTHTMGGRRVGEVAAFAFPRRMGRVWICRRTHLEG